MKILGMLQNMWVRDPAAAQRIIDHHGPRARRRMIAAWMPKTPSGRALRRAFGPTFEQIVFDNVASEVASRSDAAPPVDHLHIRRLLDQFEPDVVLAFGRRAVEALRKHKVRRLIVSRHPSPRAAGCVTLPSLEEAAALLQSYTGADSRPN